jgi:hypothetical protein
VRPPAIFCAIGRNTNFEMTAFVAARWGGALKWRMATIYEYSQRPRFWVVHDEDGYWLVPARTGGWHEREPFVGHVTGLRALSDLDGIDLGLPDDRR